ncbi:MAG: exodeoxyribonuclease VII small subunit [Clostridia bacterium]|nr:exodeoxyribonuclease VII small subunit [Clostridia bacterium]
MEAGEMTLQESLAAYEEGMKLTRALNEELSQAEKRMQELSGGIIMPMEDAP